MLISKASFGVVIVLCASLGHVVLAADAPVEWDGLQKTKVKGIDLAYVRPGVDLSKYGKVIMDPVQVQFSKDWKPEKTGSHMQVSQEDRDRIQQGLAELATKTFAETLQEKDGYPVVTTPGPERHARQFGARQRLRQRAGHTDCRTFANVHRERGAHDVRGRIP